MEELKENRKKIKVFTDAGWSDFDALAIKGIKQTVKVVFEYTILQLTLDHIVYDYKKRPIPAQSLKPGNKVFTTKGIQKVVTVKLETPRPVFDLLNVKLNNRFFANDVLISNCEFIIDEETLIAPTTLIDLEGRDPIERQGQIRWYKRPERGMTYVVALDPSLGTGGDPSAIQVLELPSFIQVAEWQHNRTPMPGQIHVLKEICAYIYEQIQSETSIYYSVENNSIGEAALICINELGEENIRGMFISEPQRVGAVRRYRKGFTTTNKNKLAVCAKLKTLIESKKLTVNSRNLVSELKNFVALAGSFKAKVGETDDLVLAMLLSIRITQVLQSFDPEIDNRLKDSFDEIIAPMPFIMVS